MVNEVANETRVVFKLKEVIDYTWTIRKDKRFCEKDVSEDVGIAHYLI